MIQHQKFLYGLVRYVSYGLYNFYNAANNARESSFLKYLYRSGMFGSVVNLEITEAAHIKKIKP